MGQEIVYCYKCSTRIVVGETGKGASYSIGDRVACAECASQLVDTLPPRERDELLARMLKTPQKGTKAPPSKRTPSRGTEAAPPTSPAPKKNPLILVSVGIALLVVVAIAAMSGGKATRTPDPVVAQPERKTERPAVVVTPPPVKESYDAELERIDASVAGVNRQEGFKESLDYLASARRRHDAADWTRAIDARVGKTNTEVQNLYESLEGKALDARRRGVVAEVKEISDRVARWNLPDRAASLKKALEGAGGTPFRQGADGIVCIEAEHCAARTDASGHSWTKVRLPEGFEGDGAMAASPNNGGQWLTGYAATASRMDFKVDFTKTGAHYVWIRASGDTDKDNSVHLGINGQPVPTLSEIGWSATKKFVWTNKQMNNKNATFTVPTTGVHTINVWMREDGAVVDRIILTNDPKWGPKGNGPPESPR